MEPRTVANILEELNRDLPNNPWVPVSTPYVLSSVIINDGRINAQPNGLILKAFSNTETAEIKFYLLRSITPEGDSLR